MNGYIKLHRKLTQWEWYTDQNTFKLFIHCLLMANHQPNKWRGITVDAGEFITSYDKLSSETGLTIQQVRTSLKRLISTQEIEQKTTSRFSVIKLLKWRDYQSSENEINTPNNKQSTNNQQATNKQLTTNKNDKNDKNVKNKEYIGESDDENLKLPYKEIVDYLNHRCDKSFKHSSRKTRDLIAARYNEGWQLDDFKYVIDVKAEQWEHDRKYSEFLRPETLFSNKFEGYRNQKMKGEVDEKNVGFPLNLI